MKMTQDETSLSSDFLNMIPYYRKKDIEGILNDTRYNWDERRNRVNNYLKTYISYDTMKSYSKLLSNKLKNQMEEDFEKTKASFNKIFGEKFKFIKLKNDSFPFLKFDFSEKDFESMPGKKYIRNEIYTGPYDRSISQRINMRIKSMNELEINQDRSEQLSYKSGCDMFSNGTSDFVSLSDDKENQYKNLGSLHDKDESNIPTNGQEKISSHLHNKNTAFEGNIFLDEYSTLLNLELPPKYEQTNYLTSSEDRLIINYIELENFKSYYGVNKMGPFGKNFSCIVGPNGSGKSNIFDCMLFVFDYNVKKFRTKKLSDLIHRSSNETCDFARVSIYFKRVGKKENEDFDIKDSSFCVTRKITKNNVSSFFLNSTKISREDLKDILKCHGIGLDHDRFLILQGEVESISLLKAKAENQNEDCMLGLIDDIIGTCRYKMALEKVNSGISDLQKKITVINARLRESERIRNLLEEKTKNCIEQNRIRNGITDLKYQKLLILEEKCRNKYDDVKQQLSEYQVIINAKNKEICELENDLKVYEDEVTETKKEYKECRNQDDVIQSSLTSNSARLEEVKRDHRKLEERLRLKEHKNNTLHQEIIKLENIPQNILIEKESNENELKEILKLEKTLRGKKEEAEEMFEKERLNYTSEYDEKQGDVINFENKINKFRDRKRKLEIKLNQIASEKNNIEKEIENIENFITELNSSIKLSLEKKEAILENMTIAEKELVSLRVRSKKFQTDIKKYEIDIANESKKYEMLKQNYNALVDHEKFSPSSEIYKFLINLNYNGFKGRLGDLALVNKKYDIALSTLGGKLLDMFVVETIKDGQFLMEQLRINGKGRGTFMCIEEINKKCGDCSSKKANNFDGSVRAFDLLENVSPELRSCFYFVFRESLVVEKSDDVNFLKKKYCGYVPKIVTLDGIIFESQGKITGGGKPISGLIGKKLYNKPKVDDKLKSGMEENLNKLYQSINGLKTQFSQILGDRHKVEIEIKNKILSIEEFKKQLYFIDGNIKNGSTCLDVKISSLEDLKKQLSNVIIDTDEYNTILKEIKFVDNEIKDMEEILETKKERFNIVKNKVDKLYEKWVEEHSIKLDNCIMNKERCQNSISHLQKKFNFSSKQYKIKTGEQERNENEIQELSGKINELHEIEVNILHAIDNLIKKKEENNKLLQTLNEKLNYHSDISKIKHQLIDLKNEIDKYQSLIEIDDKKLEELESKKKIYVEKINNLKYIFYNSMNLLPEDLIEFRDDEIFYTKRVHEAEKDFIDSLTTGNLNMSVPTVEFPIKNFNECELQEIMIKEEEIDRKIKIFKSAYLDEADDDVVLKYLEKHEIFLGNLKEFNKINKLYNQLKEKSNTWTINRIKEFNEGFNIISKSVKEVYQNITFGGDAELESCDKFDPYNFGIIYKIRPPGKSWKKMTNLSGGEKTLASLALVFALHEYNPTPLYIMDEIDAALDFRNVAIIGQYIKQRTLNAQFIVISLRKEMYELADKCIEIWKLDDKTRSACSDMSEIYELNKNYINFSELYLNSNLKQNLKNFFKLLKNTK